MSLLVSLLQRKRDSVGIRSLSRLRMPGVMRLRTTLALLAPVVLVGCMMLFELAHLGLTIYAAGAALDRSLAGWRQTEQGRADETLPDYLREHMVRALHGRLPTAAIHVQAKEFGLNRPQAAGVRTPVGVTVDVHQRYVTPLPALIGLGDAYRYRYKRFLGHPAGELEPVDKTWVPCCLLPLRPKTSDASPYLQGAAWAAGVALLGSLTWYLGLGSASVATVFVVLTMLAGIHAGGFVVVTLLGGGLLALLRLPYIWALLLGVLWWVAQ